MTLTGCLKTTTFNEINPKGEYTVLLPDYLSATGGIHKQASLQYQNEEKEVYALVIDEKKADLEAYDMKYNLDTYYENVVSKPFTETLQNAKVNAPGRQDINGNKALVAEITGTLNGVGVYYKLAIIETETKFYQVLTWTRADRKEKYENDLTRIIETLKVRAE